MYSIGAMLQKEPVVISAAIIAIVNTLVLLGIFSLTGEQVAGIDTALVLLLSLFVRSSVTAGG